MFARFSCSQSPALNPLTQFHLISSFFSPLSALHWWCSDSKWVNPSLLHIPPTTLLSPIHSTPLEAPFPALRMHLQRLFFPTLLMCFPCAAALSSQFTRSSFSDSHPCSVAYGPNPCPFSLSLSISHPVTHTVPHATPLPSIQIWSIPCWLFCTVMVLVGWYVLAGYGALKAALTSITRMLFSLADMVRPCDVGKDIPQRCPIKDCYLHTYTAYVHLHCAQTHTHHLNTIP